MQREANLDCRHSSKKKRWHLHGITSNGSGANISVLRYFAFLSKCVDQVTAMDGDWLEPKVARSNVGAGIYFARQRLRDLTLVVPKTERRVSSFSGVSLSFLQRFAALHVSDADSTTLDVVRTIIKPATEKDQCRCNAT